MRRCIGAETVVVVLGASSGIGRITALLAARRGARVVLAARSASSLDEVAARCRALGGEALAVPVDMTVPADLDRLVDAALARFDRIDVWVAAAASTATASSIGCPPTKRARSSTPTCTARSTRCAPRCPRCAAAAASW